MPVTFSERAFDPNDGPWARRSTVDAANTAAADVDADSPWVTPDYSTIPDDAHLPRDLDERYLVWPGPTMIMPGNLLPDGTLPTRDLIENAWRIQHVRYVRTDDADYICDEYRVQQRHLRDCAGLPLAGRKRVDGRMQVVDDPDTVERIKALHAEERRRREALR
ncbi:hypothetical protein [Amycolatopsis sp. NPDC059657]|uniref:hypothetical protein n=1 Tax=Amycolatopsis sp. NPDC059657 TaxID=3346899 RepID=UPI0036704AAF